MGTSSYIYAIGKRTLAAIVCALTLLGCDSVIYDGEGDCSVNYRVKFRYDMNLKFADAFAREVESVTLYLLDGGGRVVWQRTESGEALGKEGYAMEVDVAPGTYDLLAWCGSTDKGSFRIPESASGKELTCTLMRESGTDGTGHVREDLDRLYHGYLPNQTFGDTEGTYTYVVPLVKNTNNIRVVLQQMNGGEVDDKNFTFRITDDNTLFAPDNSLISNGGQVYAPWTQGQRTVGVTEEGDETVTVAYAEFSTSRLVAGNHTRLTITRNSDNAQVLNIPLNEYLLLLKSDHFDKMGDQEFLDRENNWSLIFFLDNNHNWIRTHIVVNDWIVRINDAEL